MNSSMGWLNYDMFCCKHQDHLDVEIGKNCAIDFWVIDEFKQHRRHWSIDIHKWNRFTQKTYVSKIIMCCVDLTYSTENFKGSQLIYLCHTPEEYTNLYPTKKHIRNTQKKCAIGQNN